MLRPAAPAARSALRAALRPGAMSGAAKPAATPSLASPSARLLSTAAKTTERQPWTCLHRPIPTAAKTARKQQLGGQRRWKSQEELKSRNKSGPFSWRAGLLFVGTSGFLLWFFEHEKERMKQKRMAEANKGYGKPRVGGEFELVDTQGNTFTDEDLKGRYSLVYFGFTHCPDICPEELDKMAQLFDLVESKSPRPGSLLPVFVTCDPARDDPKTLRKYLDDFHPRFVGLTGTYDQVKKTCKAYRVYFSTPEKVKPGEDYLVDHSIYFYIMDPEGEFVEVLGRQHSPEEGARIILGHMKDWKGQWKS
ncbi:Protein SCO1 mitochondrial [Zalerion maritima]|uniref:Protein SCO1 mitochondrial n=1 Tax=Zalerion maritima TaxID=339359 RepID=A0AAD5WMY4_9PEZI|nr:Protein SCO1 mitochondrial [Zalerion maritima]